LVPGMQDTWTDSTDDECDVPWDDSIITQVPNVELRDGFFIPQDSSDSSDSHVFVDHVPSDEGPLCCPPIRHRTGGATCRRKSQIKRKYAADFTPFSKTTGSGLHINDPDQLADTKSWLRSALNADYGLMTTLSEASQEVTKQVRQAISNCTQTWPEATLPAIQVGSREERRRISGSICILVRYVRVLTLADDLGVLHVGDGGRVFVTDLNPHGPAYQRGVRPGDELVRIRINHEATRIRASAQYLRSLASEPGMAHHFCEAFFMGFVGQFPAEVNVSTTNEYKSEFPCNLGKITGDTPFCIADFAAFRPSCNSLLLASQGENQRACNACTDLDNDGCPWQLLELRRQQARKLLAAAVLPPRPAGEQPVSWV